LKVKQCGGLTVFLWGLRGVDFKNFRQDFMAMGILRDRIIEAANEAEWAWKLLKSGDQLEKLFATVGDCGGVDDFLEAFEGLNLSTFTTMMGMLKSLDFGDSGGGGADQMTQWRALLKKIDSIGGIPGFMAAFGSVNMVDVRMVFSALWPHGPWDDEQLGKLIKLWEDVANMGGTEMFYETVQGLAFERLRHMVAELRSLKFIGPKANSKDDSLEKLFKLCALAGGGKQLVDALSQIDMKYFGANMELLHHAQLRDDHMVANWQRLTKRVENDGGVYRFLECHEKRENAAKMCRYCSNDLWLQRSMQIHEDKTKKKKEKQKGVQNFDPPLVSKMAMSLSHSLPPGALLPPLDHDPTPALAQTVGSFGAAPSYTPYAWENPMNPTPDPAADPATGAP
jgi:hypothetical protein